MTTKLPGGCHLRGRLRGRRRPLLDKLTCDFIRCHENWVGPRLCDQRTNSRCCRAAQPHRVSFQQARCRAHVLQGLRHSKLHAGEQYARRSRMAQAVNVNCLARRRGPRLHVFSRLRLLTGTTGDATFYGRCPRRSTVIISPRRTIMRKFIWYDLMVSGMDPPRNSMAMLSAGPLQTPECLTNPTGSSTLATSWSAASCRAAGAGNVPAMAGPHLFA